MALGQRLIIYFFGVFAIIGILFSKFFQLFVVYTSVFVGWKNWYKILLNVNCVEMQFFKKFAIKCKYYGHICFLDFFIFFGKLIV